MAEPHSLGRKVGHASVRDTTQEKRNIFLEEGHNLFPGEQGRRAPQTQFQEAVGKKSSGELRAAILSAIRSQGADRKVLNHSANHSACQLPTLERTAIFGTKDDGAAKV